MIILRNLTNATRKNRNHIQYYRKKKQLSNVIGNVFSRTLFLCQLPLEKKNSQVVHMGGVWFPDVPVSRSQQPSTGQVESMQERFDVVVHFCPAKL